jgi:hypothetical protein
MTFKVGTSSGDDSVGRKGQHELAVRHKRHILLCTVAITMLCIMTSKISKINKY